MQISQRKLDIIKEHALQVYPEECCGLLAGRYEQSFDGHYENVVYEVAPCRNVLSWDRHMGFEISKTEYCEVESEARSMGYNIIGAYHSHTNADALPSNHDYEHAIPNHTMVILSVRETLVLQVRAFFRPFSEPFQEERIYVKSL